VTPRGEVEGVPGFQVGEAKSRGYHRRRLASIGPYIHKEFVCMHGSEMCPEGLLQGSL
jgi:hypothetical protein